MVAGTANPQQARLLQGRLWRRGLRDFFFRQPEDHRQGVLELNCGKITQGISCVVQVRIMSQGDHEFQNTAINPGQSHQLTKLLQVFDQYGIVGERLFCFTCRLALKFFEDFPHLGHIFFVSCQWFFDSQQISQDFFIKTIVLKEFLVSTQVYQNPQNPPTHLPAQYWCAP